MTYPEIGDIIELKKGDYKMDTNIFSIETYSEERLKINRTLGKCSAFIDLPTDSRTMEKIYRDFYEKDDFPCLYMLGQASFENGKEKYFVKVGRTTNIKKRLKSYQHSNPSFELFGICAVAKVRRNLSKAEKRWHIYFNYFGLQVGKTEWAEVSKDFYDFYKSYGFSQVKMY